MTYITPKDYTNTHISGAPSLGMNFNPKKAGTKTAHVVFVLDSSSSMNQHYDKTLSGFNEFLETQRKSEVETFVSLYTFNGYDIQTVYDHIHIDAVPNLTKNTYKPGGMTNLRDAFGFVMSKVNEKLSSTKKKKRDSVNIVVLTDGEENSSRNYTNECIKMMVSKCEEKNWGFMFLGAGLDAFSVGSSWGLNPDIILQYSTNNIDKTMSSASSAANRMKTARSTGANTEAAYASASFTEQERNESK